MVCQGELVEPLWSRSSAADVAVCIPETGTDTADREEEDVGGKSPKRRADGNIVDEYKLEGG